MEFIKLKKMVSKDIDNFKDLELTFDYILTSINRQKENIITL